MADCFNVLIYTNLITSKIDLHCICLPDVNKGSSSQGYGFSSGHVMDVRVGPWRKLSTEELMSFELWCWRRLLRVPWTARRSNQSILKDISPGISLEGMMLKLKLQYFGHLVKCWYIGKDCDAGRDWGQEEKGMTEDEMAGWHHWLDGRESEWTVGVGQGGLACCDSWGRKESDTTERLNWAEPDVCLFLGFIKPCHLSICWDSIFSVFKYTHTK